MSSNAIKSIRAVYRYARRIELEEEERTFILELGLTLIFFAIIAPIAVITKIANFVLRTDSRSSGWHEISESTADVEQYGKQS